MKEAMHIRSSLLVLAATGLVSASASWLPFSQSSTNPHDDLRKLKVVVYETAEHSTSLRSFLNTANNYGLEATVIGGGSDFNGFGSKYQQLHETLEELKHEEDALVAILDGRDILLNVAQDVGKPNFQLRMKTFIDGFKEMVEGKPNAVLISAEQQCCVAALCHADSPAAYFDPATGKRAQRACPSGEDGCGWLDNDNVKFWQSLMMAEAYSQTESKQISPYLNAGMMVGTAKNLANIIERMDLGEEEDDQAVLSAMYLQYPELIVLDYEQKLLGNNAWPKGLEDGCIYDFEDESDFLTNKQTGTSPLILHTPGKFYDCLDLLIERLGGESDKRYMNNEGIARQLNYATNYSPTASPLAAPADEPTGETVSSEFTNDEQDDDNDDDGNSMAITVGISLAATAAIIAGFATKNRMVATRDEQNAKKALEDSNNAFVLEGALDENDPRLDEEAMSDNQSSVHDIADPDCTDIFTLLKANASQPSQDPPEGFEEVPVTPLGDGQPTTLTTMLSSPFEHCDDICGSNNEQPPAEDLRRHRSVHW